jgi:hypothetical protein
MDSFFQLTHHALGRMASRQVSKNKVAQALFCGQVFSNGNGLHRAILKELHGKTVEEYAVIFSKATKRIVTVEHNIFRIKQRDQEDLSVSSHKIRKLHKQRKRALREQEFDSWCREEYNYYNLSFTA